MPIVTQPATAPLVDDKNIVTPPWSAYFQQITTVSDGTVDTHIATAQAAANAAQAAANAVAAGLAALASSFPGGLIGDYRQTAVTNLGASWLLCDGGLYQIADYPDLAALMLLSVPDGTPTTFNVPNIAPVADITLPANPYLRTFVRAL